MKRIDDMTDAKISAAIRATARWATAALLCGTTACNSGLGGGETMDPFYRPAGAGSQAACNRVWEFTPAPGQFINDTSSEGGYHGESTPAEAAEYAMKRLEAGYYVSLGGFGGYLVVGFDHSILNSGGDYDFSVTGNAIESSCEPGIVWVMRDENGNGRPDDTWYELRGSEYGTPNRVAGYAVTYRRPDRDGADVEWRDNRGGSGTIARNTHHTQPSYYPLWIAEQEYTLTGTMLLPRDYVDEHGMYCTGIYGWGYADNYGSDRLTGGRNRFRISDAVTAEGGAALLPYIDFVKVQTAVNIQGSAGVGELSTEVLGIADEHPGRRP